MTDRNEFGNALCRLFLEEPDGVGAGLRHGPVAVFVPRRRAACISPPPGSFLEGRSVRVALHPGSVSVDSAETANLGSTAMTAGCYDDA